MTTPIDLSAVKMLNASGTILQIVLPKDYGLPVLYAEKESLRVDRASGGVIIPASYSGKDGNPVRNGLTMLAGVPHIIIEVAPPAWWANRDKR